jgi:hypothetical protein
VKKVLLFVLVFSVLFIAGCVIPPEPPDPDVQYPIKFTVIEGGSQSGITEKTHIVVNDGKAWDELYKKIHSDGSGIHATPVIDFENYTVIAVFMGEKPNNQYSFEIDKVMGSKRQVTVYANEVYKEFSPDQAIALFAVQPYEIIKIKKTKLPVVVMRKQITILPDQPDPEKCAKEGEKFSGVYADYPNNCCSGLTEWNSGMDTRISVAGHCYGTGKLAGSPIGTCINCGNGVCEEIENICNCPKDCPEKSDYKTVKEFCDKYWKPSITEKCESDFSDMMEICVFKDKCNSAPTEVDDSEFLEQYCDASTSCPEGFECASFPELGLKCYPETKEVCDFVSCPSGKVCIVALSYPVQVTCS